MAVDKMVLDREPEFVELFCGIGGFAAAMGKRAKIHASIDINQNALEVFSLNFSHPSRCKTIESLSAGETVAWADKSWWLSPPCQPFTRRGRRSELGDPRTRPFLNVLHLIDVHRPPELALENVPEFCGSRSHERLIRLLVRLGYHVREMSLCPTQFGFSNRRKRHYLIAAIQPLAGQPSIGLIGQNEIRTDPNVKRDVLSLNPLIAAKYSNAIDVVQCCENAKTACFTSAYGRSHVRSGSYLASSEGLRRFSPREILWSLGFDDDFRLPDWPNKKLWPLVGNSLAIPVVRHVISQLPSLHSMPIA